jgi:hypothetical protein
MPIIAILRVGIVLFIAGIILRFVSHLWWPLILVSGLGFALFIIATTLWSLDSPGDLSFD